MNILVGLMTSGLSILMFLITIEAPKKYVIDKLERSLLGQQLFTFRGRYVIDLLISLFLFAMIPWGILLGIVTLLIIFGIRFLGVKQPDAFNEIFRQIPSSLAMSSSNIQQQQYNGNSHYQAPDPSGTNDKYIDIENINRTNIANSNIQNYHNNNNINSDDTYTIESEYDTPVVERR